MSRWPAAKANRILAARERRGWRVKRQSGSQRILAREGIPDVVFAFHDQEELGPRMLACLAKHTGLTPDGLSSGACAWASWLLGAGSPIAFIRICA